MEEMTELNADEDGVERDTYGTQEYQCRDCEHIFDIEYDMENEAANDSEECPRCGSMAYQL
jgi:DNA-directed RNA polymerase subunit RPC12/RpoP